LISESDPEKYIVNALNGAVASCHEVSQWAKLACKGNIALFTKIGKRLAHVFVLRTRAFGILEQANTFAELSLSDRLQVCANFLWLLLLLKAMNWRQTCDLK